MDKFYVLIQGDDIIFSEDFEPLLKRQEYNNYKHSSRVLTIRTLELINSEDYRTSLDIDYNNLSERANEWLFFRDVSYFGDDK